MPPTIGDPIKPEPADSKVSTPSPEVELLRDIHMAPIWIAARQRLNQYGPKARGWIHLEMPSVNPRARERLGQMLGCPVKRRVELGPLEEALVRMGAGTDLDDALATLGYPSPPGLRAPLEPLPLEPVEPLGRETPRVIRELVHYWPEKWAAKWAGGPIVSTILGGLPRKAAEQYVRDMRILLDYLATNPGLVVGRAELAAKLFGDAHALDQYRKMGKLATCTLEWATGRIQTGTEKNRGYGSREVWRQVGVVGDQVSAPALAWAVPAVCDTPLSEQLRAATRGQLPIHINLHALLSYPVRVPPESRLLVVENPQMVESAVRRGIPACVIATSGGPSEAVKTLVGQMLKSGASVWFHADFDQGGFKTSSVLYRVGCRPWMMSSVDYLQAVQDADDAGITLPRDPYSNQAPNTTWNKELRKAYLRTGLIVHEEVVIEEVLEGFARNGGDARGRNRSPVDPSSVSASYKG